jgi:hypothetical protein
MLRCIQCQARLGSSAGKCAYDHDLTYAVQAPIQIACLDAINEKLDVPPAALLFVNDPKAQSRKSAVEICDQTVQRKPVRVDYGSIRRVVAKRSGDENAHERSAFRGCT